MDWADAQGHRVHLLSIRKSSCETPGRLPGASVLWFLLSTLMSILVLCAPSDTLQGEQGPAPSQAGAQSPQHSLL